MESSKAKLGHRLLVGLVVFASFLLVFIFAKGLSLDPKSVSSPLVGQSAKTFQVTMLQGADLVMQHPAESLELKDLLGSPVVLNFWASWCGSCAEEARIFEEFWQAHRGDGVKMLGIAVHDKGADALAFAKSLGKTYALALDEDGRAALNYGVTGVPETVFIDASGVVVHKEPGPVNRQILEKMLAKLTGKST